MWARVGSTVRVYSCSHKGDKTCGLLCVQIWKNFWRSFYKKSKKTYWNSQRSPETPPLPAPPLFRPVNSSTRSGATARSANTCKNTTELEGRPYLERSERNCRRKEMRFFRRKQTLPRFCIPVLPLLLLPPVPDTANPSPAIPCRCSGETQWKLMGLPIPEWFDPTQTRDGDGMLSWVVSGPVR